LAEAETVEPPAQRTSWEVLLIVIGMVAVSLVISATAIFAVRRGRSHRKKR